jgi:hypothetical protein
MESSKEKIEAQLCAYIDGDLTDAERVEIEQHLSSNPQHRKLMEELRGHSALLRGLPRATVPGELNESLTGQLERTALLDPTDDQSSEAVLNINRWPQITAVAAVLLLAIGLGVVVYYVLPTDQRNHGTVALDEKALKENGRAKDGVVGDGLASDWQKDQPTDNRAWSAKPADGDRKDGDGAESKKGLDKSGEKDAAMKPGLGNGRGSGLSDGAGAQPRPNAGTVVDDVVARRDVNDVLRKSRDVVTDKEVAQLREQLGRSLGQADLAAESDKKLYLFVTTPQAAVANGQVKTYFNTNNIVYMDTDLTVALSDADKPQRGDLTRDAATLELRQAAGANENPVARAKAEEPVREGFARGGSNAAGLGGAPGQGLQTANGTRGGGVGGGGGRAVEDAIPAPSQTAAAAAAAPADAKAVEGEGVVGAKVVNKPEEGAAGKRLDTESFGAGRVGEDIHPLGLKGSRRTSNPTGGVAAGAERDLTLRSSMREERSRMAEKAKVNDPAAASDTPPAPRPLDEAAVTGVGQPAPAAPGSLSASMFKQVGQRGFAEQQAEARGRNGGVILARMNRRQAVELSNVLSREKGQVAELRDPAAKVKLHAGFEYNNDYAADIDADGRTRLGTTKEAVAQRQQEPARPGKPLEAEVAKKSDGTTPADRAAGLKPTEYGVQAPQAAAPTSRAAQTDNFAARWNMPATRPANAAVGVDALRLTPDPLDEPVDVVIIVKDAAITPVAPTLTAPAADVAAPAEKPADGEKAK